MPLGLNRTSPSSRNGSAITTPHSFGNPNRSEFGNTVSSTQNFGNKVNWLPDPAHFGNVIGGAAPTFTSCTPNTGSVHGATSVTIVGTNFTPDTEILFGAQPATGVSVNSSTSLTCTTPANFAGAVSITILTPSGMVTAAAAYTYA
jgi:hypothetical protein